MVLMLAELNLFLISVYNNIHGAGIHGRSVGRTQYILAMGQGPVKDPGAMPHLGSREITIKCKDQ